MVKVHDKLFPYQLGIIPMPAIERDLPATSLVFIIIDLHIIFLQYFDHVKTCLGVYLIYKAGNENINACHVMGMKLCQGKIINFFMYGSILYPAFSILKPAFCKSFQNPG